MIDKELLILAAKAASIKWYGYYGDDEVECRYLDIGPDDVVEWNPLVSNDDAFRLMVVLQLDPYTFPHEDNPFAATRRAIVKLLLK